VTRWCFWFSANDSSIEQIRPPLPDLALQQQEIAEATTRLRHVARINRCVISRNRQRQSSRNIS